MPESTTGAGGSRHALPPGIHRSHRLTSRVARSLLELQESMGDLATVQADV
jgi:hypothetical protein